MLSLKPKDEDLYQILSSTKVIAVLKGVPKNIDLVNIFRRSEYLSEIIDEAIAVGVKTIWAQLGIYDKSAAQKAQNAGLNVIMNACIKVEYLRLIGNR
jgi:predicted CoA-binding protein